MQATIKLFSQPSALPLRSHALSEKSCPTHAPTGTFADRLARHSEANGNRENHVHHYASAPIIVEIFSSDGSNKTKRFPSLGCPPFGIPTLRRVTMPAQRQMPSCSVIDHCPCSAHEPVATPTPHTHPTA
jgi:hypothetical protein